MVTSAASDRAAGPPSPLEAGTPLPKAVVMMPLAISILRMRWLELSQT